MLLQVFAFAQPVRPQRCGIQQMHAAMIAKDPSWTQKFLDQKAALQSAADRYNQYKAQAGDERTTTISAIPIIFHIIVDSAQFNTLGGTAGIKKRCDSQIAVLNRDFNRQNTDSNLIPSSWKDSLYGNSGIHFGLARIDPSGNCSPGYEIKILPMPAVSSDTGFSNVNWAYPEAKSVGTGLVAWDSSRYYNVWCINFTDGAGILGITVPKSQAASFWPGIHNEGVCILYNTLGATVSGAGSWPLHFNLGRTLTHETGHMFEIWHPWGDDGGLCPWGNSTCDTTHSISPLSMAGSDDGLADTPPESDAVFGNPTYTIPGGTIYDCCKIDSGTNKQPVGIACLSFMDYTDDDAMHLFTPMQAAAMAAMVLIPPITDSAGATGSGTIGENYSLTQNPALLIACPDGVKPSHTELNSSLGIYPNPTTGEVTVSVNPDAETLNEIVVINMLGQQVMMIKGSGRDYYIFNLSGMSKGVYFIKCNFGSGSVTRKILLQ